jgi:hypothetical protein
MILKGAHRSKRSIAGIFQTGPAPEKPGME